MCYPNHNVARVVDTLIKQLYIYSMAMNGHLNFYQTKFDIVYYSIKCTVITTALHANLEQCASIELQLNPIIFLYVCISIRINILGFLHNYLV